MKGICCRCQNSTLESFSYVEVLSKETCCVVIVETEPLV